MHEIAEIYFDEKLEVIPTYIEDNPPENPMPPEGRRCQASAL